MALLALAPRVTVQARFDLTLKPAAAWLEHRPACLVMVLLALVLFDPALILL
jgi:hypothetical protein